MFMYECNRNIRNMVGKYDHFKTPKILMHPINRNRRVYIYVYIYISVQFIFFCSIVIIKDMFQFCDPNRRGINIAKQDIHCKNRNARIPLLHPTTNLSIWLFRDCIAVFSFMKIM